jgi:hypothetical protein
MLLINLLATHIVLLKARSRIRNLGNFITLMLGIEIGMRHRKTNAGYMLEMEEW